MVSVCIAPLAVLVSGLTSTMVTSQESRILRNAIKIGSTLPSNKIVIKYVGFKLPREPGIAIGI